MVTGTKLVVSSDASNYVWCSMSVKLKPKLGTLSSIFNRQICSSPINVRKMNPFWVNSMFDDYQNSCQFTLSKLPTLLVPVFFKSYYFSRQLLWKHTRGRCNTQGGRYFILELRITFRHTLNTFLNQFAKFWEDLLWNGGFWRHFLPSSISRKNSPNPFVALIQISLDSNYFLLSGELDKN